MSEGTTVRVFLADDEHLVRTALRAIISAEPDLDVVGEAETGADAVAQIRELRPDIVLMDVRMPGLNGIDATAHLMRSMPEPPRVLVVTTFENDDYVYDALRAGAQGFLLKRASAAEMVHAVRVVARGDSLLFPSAVRDLALTRKQQEGNMELRTRVDRLTAREQEVLRLMTAGLSNTEIADRVGLGAETVKTHVARVLAKLGVRDRTQAVIAAYESGFVGVGITRSEGPR
ncbi:response regulator transcription factor [Yinghuangia soli]|uniref:Response regulator transcription factor n=1 Tax=Yinghuangia soli TaxID=2908204 RepID=A0AA41Q655_9ACTN|nr:response regulator transcription factor [Yinghuangia soli]MCF2532293.1 response regulator transcription factor [Yinghuangia soli]